MLLSAGTLAHGNNSADPQMAEVKLKSIEDERIAHAHESVSGC